MSDHPLLLETSAGALGAMLTLPDGPCRAGMLMAPAASRFGPNRAWFRLGQALSGIGVAVLRPDLPGRGESLEAAADEASVTTATREVWDWFRRETGSVPGLVFGSCAGARPVTRLAAENQDVSGVALMVPYLGIIRSQPKRRRRLQRARRRLIRRITGAPPSVRRLESGMLEALATAARRTSVWVLVGQGDRAYRDLAEFNGGSGPASPFEVEVVPGKVLHSLPILDAQDEAIGRVLAWTRRRVEAVS